MNQQAQLIAIIQNNLQSSDNKLRLENQKILMTMTQSKLVDLSIVLINILKNSLTNEIVRESNGLKQFALTHLRKHLSKISQVEWDKVNNQKQSYIKNTLFQVLHYEKSAAVRSICADTIGQIAGGLISKNENNWKNFKESVFVLLNNSQPNSLQSSLLVFQSFFNYCPQYFSRDIQQFSDIFLKAFSHQNNQVKEASIKAFSRYIFSVPTKLSSKLQHLIIPFYSVAHHLILNDNNNTQGLQAVIQIIQLQPKILKKTFNELNDMIQCIVKLKDIEEGIKKMAIESLIQFGQKYPNLYRNNKDKLNGLIEMIFYHMIEIDAEISETWKRPPQGYSQAHEKGDEETTSFGITSVDRLISAIGQQQFLPVLSVTVQKMLVISDWRYKYASVMAISQTGEYIDDATSIKVIVDILLNLLQDQNPMLKYAACHAIGQISDDMKDYQQYYGQQSFLKLAVLLKDPVPRVVSHAASAMTNLVEGMKYPKIKQHMTQLMSALLQLTISGISIVKQSVVTTIASLAQLGREEFIPFFQKTSQILFEILKTHNKKEYRQLKGLIIEALTTMAECIGKQAFRPVAGTLIEYMISIQQSELDDVDPLKQFILGGWQRLTTAFGQDLSSYLPRLLPSLLTIVQNILLTNKSKGQDSEDDANINTYQSQQAKLSISLFKVLIKQMKSSYLPYIQQTTKIILFVVQKGTNYIVKEQAFATLPLIVQLLKSTDETIALSFSKNFIKIVISRILKQYDSSLLIFEVTSLKDIFQLFNGKFLSVEELKQFSQNIIKALLKSSSRKNQTHSLKQGLEDQQKEQLDEQIGLQEQLQVAITQLIGQLFRTHKQMNMDLVNYIVNNLLPTTFKSGLSDNMYKFGLFLIDDMVQHLGYQFIPQIWKGFIPVLIRFCLYNKTTVRQAACYGLGIYAQRTPCEVFKQFIQPSLKSLIQAAGIPKSTQAQKYYQNSKDNSISAIGKIIKHHGSSFDTKAFLMFWLQNLPIQYDKQQAHIQHDFLADIVTNNLSLLLTNEQNKDLSILLRIIQIFATILKTKLVTPQITIKIKASIDCLNKYPVFVSNSDSFMNKLTQIQKKKLEQLTKIDVV